MQRTSTRSALIALICVSCSTICKSGSTEHPALWFGKSDIPTLQQRTKDASLAELWGRVQQAALSPPRDFDIRGVQAAGVAYNLTGDNKFARPAIQILLRIAKDTSWPSRKGTGHGDIKWCGLETGTNAKVLGTGYDLLYHAMSAEERKTIRDCLVQRVWPKYLAAFAGGSGRNGHPTDTDGHYEWWTDTYCNWAAWLSGGVGVSALAFYDEEPLAKQVVEQVVKSMVNLKAAFDQKVEDGGWDEGPMYWSTTFGHAVYFFAALERVTGSDAGFFKLPGVALTPQYLIDFTAPDGKLVAFNDCNFITPSFVCAELFLSATRFQQPAHAWYGDFYRPKWFEQAFAIVWRPAGPTPAAPPASDVRWYRDVHWAVLRTPNLYVPFKGGDLGANHGQLDAGTFLVYANGQRLLNDPGYGKRETEVHNTLLVDGKGQAKKGRFEGREASPATAPIERCTKSGPDRYLVCDVTPCYEEPLKLFRRHMVVSDEDWVIVFDELAASKPAQFTLNLHSDQDLQGDASFQDGARIGTHARVTALGEGGNQNKVGSSGAGKAFSITSPGPRAGWRCFTLLTTGAATPSVKAEFAADRAVLTVNGQKFTFALQSGKHEYVPRSGSPLTDLAGVCPGAGTAPVALATAVRPPLPQPVRNVTQVVAPVQPAGAQSAVSETELGPWIERLHTEIRARVAAGEHPRAFIRVFGAKAEAVKVLSADEKTLLVEYRGSKLPFEWPKLRAREDCLNLALAFCTSPKVDDWVLRAVFQIANGKKDEAEQSLAQAVAADPETGPVAVLEVRGAFGE